MVPIPSSALVLVAVMPELRDLEIARLLGWYRIPLRFAPKVVDVDYLAFYQPAAFGAEHRWRVETAAEVRGHELVTRAELFRDEPDHPRAREEYYKIALGPLIHLPQPIVAEAWRRVTFFYTTGELLQAASSLKDLTVRSEERPLLWAALRERALRTGQYRTEELPELPLDAELLAFLGGMEWENQRQGEGDQ